MTVVTSARSSPGEILGGGSRRARRGPLLTPRWRKAVLVLHVITSVGLLGVDAAILVLTTAGGLGSDPLTTYPATRLLGTTLVVPLAVAALATGVALGAFTRWGLVRYWWVLIKLVLTAGGTVLAVLVLAPTLGEAADLAVAGRPLPDPFALVKDSGGATGVLMITTLLAYGKPLGRVRRRPPRPRPGR